LKKAKVHNAAASIEQFLRGFRASMCEAVVEATCNYYWMYEELSGLGCQVILAHPLKTRAIADAKVKNDRLDATILADLLRAKLIPESYIPPKDIRDLRELAREHNRLVRMRTRVKNQCHALLTKLNIQATSNYTDLFGLRGREWLRGLTLPDVFEFQKHQSLDQIEYLNELVKKTDRRVDKALQQYPEAKRLRSIPRIGVLGAAIIIAEIGRIECFHSAKQLSSYAGIVPGLYESGNTSHSRGIPRQGSSFLRWILCEATQQHVRRPGPLRTFYLRLKEKKGNGRAIVATARKLLVQVYYVLKERPTYNLVLAG